MSVFALFAQKHYRALERWYDEKQMQMQCLTVNLFHSYGHLNNKLSFCEIAL